jgi:hypothetical protein
MVGFGRLSGRLLVLVLGSGYWIWFDSTSGTSWFRPWNILFRTWNMTDVPSLKHAFYFQHKVGVWPSGPVNREPASPFQFDDRPVSCTHGKPGVLCDTPNRRPAMPVIALAVRQDGPHDLAGGAQLGVAGDGGRELVPPRPATRAIGSVGPGFDTRAIQLWQVGGRRW